MSNTPPNDPAEPQRPVEPTQPTEVYPPAYQAQQPAYAAQPPAGGAVPPAGNGQPGYPQQPNGTGPSAPDTRSKGVAWTALILAIVGVVLVLFGFVPIPWFGFFAVLLGGLVLLIALIVSIVGLVGKRNGGKPLSITALVLSVVGGILGVVALLASLVFIGLAAGGTSTTPAPTATTDASESPAPTPTDEASASPSPEATAPDASAGDEAAYLADVRPKVQDIMGQLDPSITPEIVDSVFTDDTLLTVGRGLLVTGPDGIDAIVEQTLPSMGGAITADQLRSLYQTIYDSADTYLR